MNDAILAILLENTIDPNKVVSNGQTAYQFLEGQILGAIEQIQDGMIPASDGIDPDLD